MVVLIMCVVKVVGFSEDTRGWTVGVGVRWELDERYCYFIKTEKILKYVYYIYYKNTLKQVNYTTKTLLLQDCT